MKPWIVPSATELVLMAVCGGLGASSITLQTQAFRIAPSSTLAPLGYSSLILSMLWATILSDTFPDIASWIGFAAIIAAGLLVIRAEAQKEKAAPEGAA